MTTSMTERDETTGTTSHRYHHTRTVEIAGRTVRAHVERDFYINQSRAVAEALNEPHDVDHARRRRAQRLVGGIQPRKPMEGT